MFFAGRLKRPPWETRARVEATVKRLDRTPINNYGVRFRFTTLQTRLSRFIDLWDRALRAREEGRPGPLMQQRDRPSRRRPTRSRIASSKSRRSTTRREKRTRCGRSTTASSRRGRQAGQERVAFDKFAKLVSTQVRALKDKGGTDVAFRVAIKDGKVALTARALRATDEYGVGDKR